MGFKIIVSKKAQDEIENATDYYAEINITLALKFFTELKATYNTLKLNPNYQIKHKNYRAVPLKIFPFLLFYVVDVDNKTIKILSCFHTSKNSKKYPK
ncbi:type II toxin-antitoxin system RelE/ParE family toxin [Flavobacterium paronense]|uniref:Type II toxin-antitoxin system RelE/ParE family toxin n=1 Tax=Flavobacterium paronense TaxID=1392775 RepID=A0ABV5GB96_9FLAO|nr:type II toxin-antitoxin system RelE/ParE family toxin [Flavobacterium paronense]MDN3676867.1 type II toxin-antitoxin system RelE/ParE family toxin [Flavobacterium paronense]